MKVLWIVLAVLFLLGGMANASEATLGAVLVATGGVLAVFARIVQAGEQHKELLALMRGEGSPDDAFVKALEEVKADNEANG
jgi:pyrimidine deaminase RibD-like protein